MPKRPPIFIDPVGREVQDLYEVWTSVAYETIIPVMDWIVKWVK